VLLKPQPRLDLRRVLLALPLSLLAHGLMVALFIGYSQLTASPPRPKKVENRPVALRRIDSRAWANNRGRAMSTPVERPAPLHPDGQVVDVAPGNNQQSKDAKYLATTDNKVLKETRAKEQTNKYSRATAKTQAKPEQLPSAKGEAAPIAPPKSGINLSESILGTKSSPLLAPQKIAGSSSEVEAAPAVPGSESGTQSTPGADTEGGGAPNDDLNDVEAGDGTFLNTREWKYAAFFNRVKQAVSARWDPNARLRAKSRGLGALNRVTVLHVALRPDGSLADVQVAQSCGLDELDVEAMNAFTKAQPFSNPPAALVEGGFIRFGFSFSVTDQGMASPLPFRFR
jgi:TonB family protein